MSVCDDQSRTLIDSEKAALRKRMRGVRKIAADATDEFAFDAQVDVVRQLVEPGDVLSGYAAIHSEPDVFGLMAASGVELCLPVVPGPNQPLIFRSYFPGDLLVEGAFGARTPSSDKVEERPTVLLVPLLAFDDAGFRLGYGGGFYDRTIASLKPRLTIGVSYAAQRVERVPTGPFDLSLNHILTEQGLL